MKQFTAARFFYRASITTTTVLALGLGVVITNAHARQDSAASDGAASGAVSSGAVSSDAVSSDAVQNDASASTKPEQDAGDQSAERPGTRGPDGPPRRPSLRDIFIGERGGDRAGDRAGDRGGERGPGRNDRGPRMPPRPEARDIPDNPPSPEEWNVIVQFMEVKSPVRLRIYERVIERTGENGRMGDMIRNRLTRVHRGLMLTQSRAPDLYEFAERQFMLEDQLLGLGARIRIRKDVDTAPLLEERDNVLKQFIDNNLAERQTRLENWRKLLEAEEAKLAHDRANTDDVRKRVEDRFREEFEGVIKTIPRMFDDENDIPRPATQPSN